MPMRVLLAFFVLLAVGCSNSEEMARTSFQAFAKSIESRLPELVREYDEDGGRVTKLSSPMTWSFNRVSRWESEYEATIRFVMDLTLADGTETEIKMASHYECRDDRWSCTKHVITRDENKPVPITGEALQSSAERSKLAKALCDVR